MTRLTDHTVELLITSNANLITHSMYQQQRSIAHSHLERNRRAQQDHSQACPIGRRTASDDRIPNTARRRSSRPRSGDGRSNGLVVIIIGIIIFVVVLVIILLIVSVVILIILIILIILVILVILVVVGVVVLIISGGGRSWGRCGGTWDDGSGAEFGGGGQDLAWEVLVSFCFFPFLGGVYCVSRLRVQTGWAGGRVLEKRELLYRRARKLLRWKRSMRVGKKENKKEEKRERGVSEIGTVGR